MRMLSSAIPETLCMFPFCPIMATLPSKLPSDNVSCHRALIYLRALFIDTCTSTDHCAHTTVLRADVASLRFAVLLQQHRSPPTSLHGKGHAGHMTCYLKRTWWIPKAGQAQSNYTPGSYATFAELRLSDILFLSGSLWRSTCMFTVSRELESTDVLRGSNSGCVWPRDPVVRWIWWWVWFQVKHGFILRRKQ